MEMAFMTSFGNCAPSGANHSTTFLPACRSTMANLFKFYFDFMSPASRPLWILFSHAKIRCEMIQVALRKGTN